MISLFHNLVDAKSFASRANAERVLEKNAPAIPETATVFTVERPSDGRWLAVVIYRNDLVMNIPYLVSRGICIVN